MYWKGNEIKSFCQAQSSQYINYYSILWTHNYNSNIKKYEEK